MFEPVRGGTRGGQAEFKWSDVSQDKDREVRERVPFSGCTQSVNTAFGLWLELSRTQYQRPDRTVAEEQGHPLVPARGPAGGGGAAGGAEEDQGGGGGGPRGCSVRDYASLVLVRRCKMRDQRIQRCAWSFPTDHNTERHESSPVRCFVSIKRRVPCSSSLAAAIPTSLSSFLHLTPPICSKLPFSL